MISKNVYTIRYGGKEIKMRYTFDREVAVREGGGRGMFQEMRLLERIKSMDLKGVYVDVGANVGNHSLFFANFCPSTMVIPIEANPEIWECLMENINSNELPTNIMPIKAAAWNKPEELWMDTPPLDNSGRAQIVGLGKFATHRRHKVRGERLDKLLEGIKDIVLMKFDVEDAEEQALCGAHHIIATQKPVIVTEAHDSSYLAKHRKILEPLGYTMDPETYDPRGETRLWLST